MRTSPRHRLTAAALACVVIVVASPTAAHADVQRNRQWYLRSLRVADAHRVTEGKGVTVAVIDSGVWAGHPDLDGAVLPGFNVLGKGDGRDDLEGHGTAMAGV